jgi:hypothetical protein
VKMRGAMGAAERPIIAIGIFMVAQPPLIRFQRSAGGVLKAGGGLWRR